MKTYVLAGYDHNGAFTKTIADYKNDPNVIVIYQKPGVPLEEAVKKIIPPAHLVLACHGSDISTFTWHKPENSHDVGRAYNALFEALPRSGILTIRLESCHGGTFGENNVAAQNAIPQGTLVFAEVSGKAMGWNGSSSSRESSGLSKPIDLVLETLDNCNAKRFAHLQRTKFGDNINQNDVMPRTMIIGGNPPIHIDYDNELDALAILGKNKKLDVAAFTRAAKRVETRFDNQTITGPQLSQSSDAYIEKIAQAVRDGKIDQLKDVDARRVGYALALAYMHETGELDRLVKQAKGEIPSPDFTLFDARINREILKDFDLKNPLEKLGSIKQHFNISPNTTGLHIGKDQISALQQKLQSAGFTLKITGTLDRNTISAIAETAEPIEISRINFTNPKDAEYILFTQKLENRIEHQQQIGEGIAKHKELPSQKGSASKTDLQELAKQLTKPNNEKLPSQQQTPLPQKSQKYELLDNMMRMLEKNQTNQQSPKQNEIKTLLLTTNNMAKLECMPYDSSHPVAPTPVTNLTGGVDAGKPRSY